MSIERERGETRRRAHEEEEEQEEEEEEEEEGEQQNDHGNIQNVSARDSVRSQRTSTTAVHPCTEHAAAQ